MEKIAHNYIEIILKLENVITICIVHYKYEM
jgi:hypothetical protein